MWGDAGTQAIAASCGQKPGEAILLLHSLLGKLAHIFLCAIPEGRLGRSIPALPVGSAVWLCGM